jgi:hypothetical protein
MKLRTLLAGTAVAALALPTAASAQTQPVNGGTEVGGFVNSFLELIISQPRTSFAKFSKAKTYQTSFDAMMTSTDDCTLLTLADGEAASGSKLGHLISGRKRLPQPLEARVGKSAAFQPLDVSVDPLLKKWGEADTRDKATVTLRQKVKSKTSASYRKVLLVTLSSETP